MQSRLTVAVVFYLVLDLVTPMVPGIVPLVGVLLEADEGCRTRTYEAPAPVMVRYLSPVLAQPEDVARRETRSIKLIPYRSRFEPSSPGPPSSADDD